ncbi:MAG: HipA domain-containing protein [Draconibacterium sp.]|nr:HipA domain-containing protein [Draconibacterium sp.]
MELPKIYNCPGTLSKGFDTYSTTCLNKVFFGKKVSHFLNYYPPHSNDDDDAKFIENRKRISVSGVQEKLSLILDKNKLRLTKEGEQGNYILKPIPRDLTKVNQVPANEHLTMQIASQVYGIQTAQNALIFFKNGEPAYITKRFDIKEDGSKWGVEDFASLAGATVENAGYDFKYNSSYEELSELIRKFVPTYIIELERFFSLIVFNFLFLNGDAHLKNFSIMETINGDYRLSPAYDLINTRIHVRDTDFALDKGLFKDDFESEQMKNRGMISLADFYEFARRLGITKKRRDKLLAPFLIKQPIVEKLIHNSFLDNQTKRAYLLHFQTRRNNLRKQ